MGNAELIAKLETREAGFKLILAEAENSLKRLSAEESFLLATEMYESDVYQARMFATLIFGRLAACHQLATKFIVREV